MIQKKNLTISEFSKLTGINRDNLRFYDNAGLLVPEKREANGYRSYSRKQLSSAYLITSLRGIGVGLEEIKRYSQERNPQKMMELFTKQDKYIQEEIARLKETRDIMQLYAQMAERATREEKEKIFLEFKEREDIYLCIEIPEGMDEEEAEKISFDEAWERGVNVVYPLGGIINQDKLTREKKFEVSRFYFRTRRNKNAVKPAGHYVVMYVLSSSWDSPTIIKRLQAFMKKNKLVQSGEIYIEYHLDHVAIQSPEDYCVRIEIPIKN